MVPNHYDGSPAMPNAIVIDAGQPARFAALGQAVYWRFGGPARVLEYGETLSVMGFTCNVQESGVSCREDATGNGFSFSADGYKFEYTPVLQTTTAAPQVVLGSSMGGSSVGYGTERPATISLGSCANAISSITWDSWGEPVAHGDGTACAQTGTPAHYALVASDLGLCQGVLAYRTFQIGPNDPQSICE
jgi:hypothetical protein